MTDPVDAMLDAFAAAAPAVRAACAGGGRSGGTENPSGETRRRADRVADDLFADRLLALRGVGTYASEERPDPLARGEGLSVAVDPLDGSSNLRSNNPVGTLFAAFDAPLPATGADLVAAGYVLYGPVTTMVVAREGDATEYRVEGGTRTVRSESLSLPSTPSVCGFGGVRGDWTPAFRDRADEVRETLSTRYAGALVADVNQVLHRGGVFAYPAVTGRPDGKLRHQFEGVPVAAVVEAAGGASSDGEGSLLDATAADLHARTPVCVGDPDLVADLAPPLG